MALLSSNHVDTFKLTVKKEITPQQLYDVLTTAVEGGVGYWVDNGDFKNVTVRRDKDKNVTALFFEGTGQIPIKYKDRGPCFATRPQDDTQFLYCIFPIDIVEAAQKILNSKGPDEFGYGPWEAAHELTKGEDADLDADAVDCLVQVAAFGEIVYG
jgi:hypothetical protein